MLKKLLLAGFLAVASLSPLGLESISASPSIPPSIPRQRIIQAPEYSDFLKFINPKTKLPNERYLDKKPYEFFSDDEGDYMSKKYKFGDFDCSMFFAVKDLDYTDNENEIMVKLEKYPKYIRLEISMLFQKTYVDKNQDGIDGKNEREYSPSAHENNFFEKDDFSCIPVSPDFSNKNKKLYDILKEYLVPKSGLPSGDFLTDKPTGLSFFGGRMNVIKTYMLDGQINERDDTLTMSICSLYFPVNDANFGETKEKDTIILRLNKNPNFINLTKAKYNQKENDISIIDNLWFKDPKMDSINGNEVPESEFPNQKKNNSKELLI